MAILVLIRTNGPSLPNHANAHRWCHLSKNVIQRKQEQACFPQPISGEKSFRRRTTAQKFSMSGHFCAAWDLVMGGIWGKMGKSAFIPVCLSAHSPTCRVRRAFSGLSLQAALSRSNWCWLIKPAVERAEGQLYQAGGVTSVLQSGLMNKQRQWMCWGKHAVNAKRIERQNTRKSVNWR